MQVVDPSREQSETRVVWLDALRGWAIVAVISVHSGQAAKLNTGIFYLVAAAGQYGVQLFFVVSAITISFTYEAHIRKFGNSRRAALSWFVRRVFRIAPLYYFAIAFYAIERTKSYSLPHDIQMQDIFANIAFVHAWIPSAISGYRLLSTVWFQEDGPLAWR